MTLQNCTRRARTGSLLATLAALALAGTATAAVAASADDEKAALAAQDRRFEATVEADAATLRSLLSDDMTYTHSSAKVDTKASFIESLTSGQADYQSIVPEERDVRLHGNTAVIAGIAHVLVKAGGNDIDVRLRFTEVYVKEGGAWKMLLWHSTRVP